jgi:hypothetical protein
MIPELNIDPKGLVVVGQYWSISGHQQLHWYMLDIAFFLSRAEMEASSI